MCADHHSSGLSTYKADVAATIDAGFTSLKIDGCGAETNQTIWADLFNASRHPVLMESKARFTTFSDGDCNSHFFRT